MIDDGQIKYSVARSRRKNQAKQYIEVPYHAYEQVWLLREVLVDKYKLMNYTGGKVSATHLLGVKVDKNSAKDQELKEQLIYQKTPGELRRLDAAL